MVNAVENAFPRYDLLMQLYTDACGYGIGACLNKKQDGDDGPERPLAFISRFVSKSESAYCISELEMLSAVWAIKKLRSIIWDCKVIIFTDHIALTWLMTKRDLTGRILRYAISIAEYDIEIRYRNGKLQVHADCLSRYPMKETDEEEERKISNSILAIMLSAPTTNGSYDFKQPEGKDEELEGAEVKQRIADHIYELQR